MSNNKNGALDMANLIIIKKLATYPLAAALDYVQHRRGNCRAPRAASSVQKQQFGKTALH